MTGNGGGMVAYTSLLHPLQEISRRRIHYVPRLALDVGDDALVAGQLAAQKLFLEFDGVRVDFGAGPPADGEGVAEAEDVQRLC